MDTIEKHLRNIGVFASEEIRANIIGMREKGVGD